MNDELMASVYIATKDKELSASLQDLLYRAGFTVETFDQTELMLGKADQTKPLCILAGEHTGEPDTTDLISQVKNQWPEIPIIVVTKNGKVSRAIKALKAGAFDYLEAPVVDLTLLKSLEDAITGLNTTKAKNSAGNDSQ